MNLNPTTLIRDGGVMMMVLLALASFAMLMLIILFAIRGSGRKVPSSWFVAPGLAVWSVATLSTWQGLRMVRAAASQAPEDMQASMTSAGYSIAHAHVWLGWGLASILFLAAAGGLGILALATAGKGARVQKMTLALMLLATIVMTPLTGALCISLGEPQVMLFAGSAAAITATLGMLALTLASARLHTEDEERRLASASDRVAVGLLATLATVCMLMSFGTLGEIEAFNGLANAPPDLQQMIVAKGLGMSALCASAAKWLAAALFAVAALVCRSLIGLALGPSSRLGKRALIGFTVLFALLLLGLSSAENSTVEEGLGYNVHSAMWAKAAEMNAK